MVLFSCVCVGGAVVLTVVLFSCVCLDDTVVLFSCVCVGGAVALFSTGSDCGASTRKSKNLSMTLKQTSVADWMTLVHLWPV